MDRYGLLGYPLGHSFSRQYFLEKFEKEGIEADFKNFEFAQAQDMLKAVASDHSLKGFAITIPHKEHIIPFLDECDKAIDHIGAVNCVKVIREGDNFSLKGYNTDVIGFKASLKSLLQPQHKKALILGTGGASKAVAYVLHQLGIRYEVVSRRKSVTTLCYDDISPEKMQSVQLVVNTTPLGMSPKVDSCPQLPYEAVTSQHYFYDLIYNPEETLFLQKAKAQGAITKSGLDMLELQAEANWKIWNSDYDAKDWSIAFKN